MSNTPPRVWLATIHHKHGVNGYAAVSEQRLYRQLADYCREWWAAEAARHSQLPAHAPGDDRETVERYFEVVDEEGLAVAEESLSGAALVVAAAPAPAAGRAGQRRVIVLEFLSGPVGVDEPREEDLSVLVDEAVGGDLSMTVLADFSADVDGPTLAQLAEAQGSDPDFFGLDANGRPVEQF